VLEQVRVRDELTGKGLAAVRLLFAVAENCFGETLKFELAGD
jgi:hypothetical protein